MSALSTSDWIAISSTAIQVVVAMALCVWQVRSSKPPAPRRTEEVESKVKSGVIWFFKNAWMFLLGLIVSSLLLWSEASSNEPVSRSTLLVFSALSFWLVFNLVFLSGYAIAAVVKGKFNALRNLAKDA